MEAIDWKVLHHKYHHNLTYYFLRKIPCLPIHFLKIQRLPLELIDWDFAAEVEANYRVIETVVEIDHSDVGPVEIPELTQRGYVRAKDFMLTTKTRMIDLTKSELQLIKAMKPKTRYNLKQAQKHDLVTRVLPLKKVINNQELVDQYYDLLDTNARRIKMLLLPKNWIWRQWQAFQNQGFIVEISKDSELVAMATFYCSDNVCSYNLNASTELGRKFFAPTLAVWEGIKKGKEMGKSVFDFDGIYDERYPKSQKRFAGFGRFKAGFGGEEVYFPPMYRKRTLNRLFDLG